jgi:hypothetical protein
LLFVTLEPAAVVALALAGREPRSTSATMIAIAPVDWIAMNVVPVSSVPPTIPNR